MESFRCKSVAVAVLPCTFARRRRFLSENPERISCAMELPARRKSRQTASPSKGGRQNDLYNVCVLKVMPQVTDHSNALIGPQRTSPGKWQLGFHAMVMLTLDTICLYPAMSLHQSGAFRIFWNAEWLYANLLPGEGSK